MYGCWWDMKHKAHCIFVLAIKRVHFECQNHILICDKNNYNIWVFLKITLYFRILMSRILKSVGQINKLDFSNLSNKSQVVDDHTVNWEIYESVLFSWNFAYAKFCENKPSWYGKITLSFTDKGQSCCSCKFLTSEIYLLTLFTKIKF